MPKIYKKAISILVIASFLFFPQGIYALPEGEQIIAGNASFDRSLPETLNINVTTDKLIANYNSFSIAGPEAVNFLQPSSSSIALNRVVGVNPSNILGRLTATGKIFLVNPNGVLFGQGCRVDTAGLVASTLNITDSDFLAGRYTFYGQGNSVVNQGYIASPGGYVTLLGATAENSGIIEAQLGSVALVSGEAITLNLDPQGLISVVIDKATTKNLDAKAEAVKNSGTIKADAGRVILTAKTLDGVFARAVNTQGIIEANAISNHNGEVILEANQRVNIAGTISAEGGTVRVDSQGADISADITAQEAIFNMNDGDTVINGASFSGDNTGTYTSPGNLQLWDNGNISVIGDLAIIGGNLTLIADNDNNHWGNLTTAAGISTDGGNIYLKGQNVKIDGLISSGGGKVELIAPDSVYHFSEGDVITQGGDFIGKAGNTNCDYHLKSGSSIDTGEGIIDIYAWSNIYIGYPYGSIIEPGAYLSSNTLISLTAQTGSILQTGGKITVGQDGFIEPPVIISTSPDIATWSNDNTVDVTWRLGETEPSGSFTAVAGRYFTMDEGAEISTNGGDASVTAGKNISLTLIDAGKGSVNLSSNCGSIIDNDLGIVGGSGPYPLQEDYDIIAGNIQMSAPYGSVGGSSPHEIDQGSPASLYGFSYFWDELSGTVPNLSIDTYAFATTSAPLADSDNWWFHIATVYNGSQSTTVHAGPFYIDTTAPVITANYPAANTYGWYNYNVPVTFDAEDNLSGIVPDGSLLVVGFDSGVTSGEGTNLTVSSDGVYDQAGNFAAGITTGPFKVDQTAPVISSGTPIGSPGPIGFWLTPVTVPFSATDNLSGFVPVGLTYTDLPAKTASGLEADLYVSSDGIFDRADNFAPGITVGPFIRYIPAPAGEAFYHNEMKHFKAYYEILSPHRVVGIEPATPVTFFGYHPLIQTDFAAFDEIILDVGAYEFISNNINLKKPFAPFFGG